MMLFRQTRCRLYALLAISAWVWIDIELSHLVPIQAGGEGQGENADDVDPLVMAVSSPKDLCRQRSSWTSRIPPSPYLRIVPSICSVAYSGDELLGVF